MSEIKLAGGWTIENVREEILEHIWIDETGDMGGVHCMHCLGYEQGEIDRILELATSALREQNRVLDGALRLVLESWVNGRKVRDGIGAAVLVTAQAALTATSQEATS